MATNFKNWTKGKPLANLLPNNSTLSYWWKGKLVNTFGGGGGGTVLPADRLSLTLHQNSVTTKFDFVVFVNKLSLTFTANAVRCEAGATEEVQVESAGITLVSFPLGPGIRVESAGITLVYKPGTSVIVSAPLVSLTLSQLDPLINHGQRLVQSVLHLVSTPLSVSAFAGTAIVETVGVSIAYDLPQRTLIEAIGVSVGGEPFLPVDVSQVNAQVSFQLPPTVEIAQCAIVVGYIDFQPDVVCAVEVLFLTLTQYAPTIGWGISVPVGIQSLTIQAIDTSMGFIIIPIDEVLPLTFTQHDASTILSATCHASILHLTFTQHPLASAIVTVSTLHLTLTCRDVVSISVIASVSTIHCEFTMHQPYWATAHVTPATLHLIITPKTPKVLYSGLAEPTIRHLVLSQHDASAVTGVSIGEVLHLNLNTHSVVVSGSARVLPTILHLTINSKVVSVRISQRLSAELLHLTLELVDPVVTTGARIYETLHLTLTPLATVPRTSVNLPIDLQHLIISPHTPGTIPTYPYLDSDDLLHKERSWAAHFTHDLAQYADRGSVSSNFPFEHLSTEGLSICFWVRIKNLPTTGQPSDRTIITKTNCFSVYFTYNWLMLTLHMSGTRQDNLHLFAEDHDFRFAAGRWYHVGISVNRTTGLIHTQVWDDFLKVLKSSRVHHEGIYSIDPPWQTFTGGISVGKDPDSDTAFFDGYLDELVLFNAVRSPMEMDAIRNGTYSGQLTGCGVSESALQLGFENRYKVTVDSTALTAGVWWAPSRKVDGTGLLVGYILQPTLPIPPAPIVGAASGEGEGSDFCHLSYKFTTDVFTYDYGSNAENRFDNFTLPTRQLETSIGCADDGAYWQLKSALRSGANIYSVPMFALRTTIVDHARAGQTVISVSNASNFDVNEAAVIVRANNSSIFDLVTVTSIAGNTLLISAPLAQSYHPFKMPSLTQRYDERSSYIVPCMTGVLEILDHGLYTPRPTYMTKVKLDGGVYVEAVTSDAVPEFVEVPFNAAYLAPRVERVIQGTSDGILSLMQQLTTSRLAFDLEWSFLGDKWKLLRALFFNVKGRTQPFYLPTWSFELRVKQFAAQGSTQICLDPEYAEVFTRFPRLYVMCGRNANRFSATTTGSVDVLGGDVAFSCEPLAHEVYPGDMVCFYPQVRFLEDELTFEFMDIEKCTVKATFIEVLA